MLPRTLLLVQMVCTLSMAGIIWFVQVVHYPLFLRVAPLNFVSYEAQHATRTGWVVGPLMCLELAASMALLIASLRPAPVTASAAWAGAALVGVIWISTALIQVPLHHQLAAGFDSQAIKNLVLSNWIRTIAWTFRAALVLFWTEKLMKLQT